MKTVVTRYVPFGDVADVVMVTALAEAEKLHETPSGRFRHATDTPVDVEGSVTGYVAVEPAATPEATKTLWPCESK